MARWQRLAGAAAALYGAGTTVIALRLGASRDFAMGVGFADCFLLRIISAWQGWNLSRIGA